MIVEARTWFWGRGRSRGSSDGSGAAAVAVAAAAAMRVDQHKPREVAKNQMLDNNTSCAIREIR